MSLFTRRHRRDDAARMDEAEVDALVDAWDRAAQGAGFVRRVETVSGTTIIVPAIVNVVLGHPTRLTIRLEPGQTVADVRTLAPRLAPHLGAQALRVDAYGIGDYVVIGLLDRDPLADVWRLPATAPGLVLLARDEQGDRIAVAPEELGHAVVQGQTRAGKSGLLYAVLAQLAELTRAGYPIRVDGVDPSGLLLRPFPGSVLSLAAPDAVEAYLRAVVEDMDARIARIPRDRDTLPISADYPLRFVVLEEYPGLLRHLDAHDTKQAKRVRALVARLLAESHKAGLRVILVAQRAESNLLGSTERGQCAVRISLRVDGLDAVKLLHPDADPVLAAQHSTAPPGIVLISIPGRQLTRARVPWIGGYSTFIHRTERAA